MGIGNINMDISASAETWNIVRQFSLDNTVSFKNAQHSEATLFSNPVEADVFFSNNYP
jgi:hypothetical protein